MPRYGIHWLQKGRAAHPSRAAAPSSCSDGLPSLRQRPGHRTVACATRRDESVRSQLANSLREHRSRGATQVARRKIAVVGSGVAGLTAAHVLQRGGRRHPVRGRRAAGRARRHARGRRTASGQMLRGRHRLHRPQPPHLPDPAAPVRRTRRRHAGVGDEHVDLVRRLRSRVRRRPRAVRTAALAAGREHAALPAPAASRSVASTGTRATLLAERDRRPHPGRVLRRQPFRSLLRAALPHPADLGRVVDRTESGRRLPGAVSVLVPGQPRRAAGHRVADLVHRRRRIRALCGAGREGSDRRRDRDADPRGAPRARRRRDPHRRRRHRALRRRGHCDPSRPGGADARSTDPSAAGRSRRDRLHGQLHRAAHRHARCCRRRGGRRRPGTTRCRTATCDRPPCRSATT